MGKKIQEIGRYVMDGTPLGKGNFARVELATHGVTQIKVRALIMPPLGPFIIFYWPVYINNNLLLFNYYLDNSRSLCIYTLVV